MKCDGGLYNVHVIIKDTGMPFKFYTEFCIVANYLFVKGMLSCRHVNTTGQLGAVAITHIKRATKGTTKRLVALTGWRAQEVSVVVVCRW